MWWVGYHGDRFPRWSEPYVHSLVPLQQSPELIPVLHAYQGWWRTLPAPRSWRRAKLVSEIDSLKGQIRSLDLYLLDMRLSTLPRLVPGEEFGGKQPPPKQRSYMTRENRLKLQSRLAQAELELRQFDAK